MTALEQRALWMVSPLRGSSTCLCFLIVTLLWIALKMTESRTNNRTTFIDQRAAAAAARNYNTDNNNGQNYIPYFTCYKQPEKERTIHAPCVLIIVAETSTPMHSIPSNLIREEDNNNNLKIPQPMNSLHCMPPPHPNAILRNVHEIQSSSDEEAQPDFHHHIHACRFRSVFRYLISSLLCFSFCWYGQSLEGFRDMPHCGPPLWALMDTGDCNLQRSDYLLFHVRVVSQVWVQHIRQRLLLLNAELNPTDNVHLRGAHPNNWISPRDHLQ